MVLVPSDVQPELPTVVVEGSAEGNRGLGATGQFTKIPVLCLQEQRAWQVANAVLVQLPSLGGGGQANMASVEVQPWSED